MDNFERTISKLARNDPSVTDVGFPWLCDRLPLALEGNTHVQRIRLYRSYIYSSMCNERRIGEMVEELCLAIKAIPSFRSLSLVFNRAPTGLEFFFESRLFHHTRGQLKELEIEKESDDSFDGYSFDSALQSVARDIMYHPSLEKFSLDQFDFNGASDETMALLFWSLESLPNLKTLHFANAEYLIFGDRSMDKKYVRWIQDFKSLAEIHFCGFDFDTKQAEVLLGSSTMTRLEVDRSDLPLSFWSSLSENSTLINVNLCNVCIVSENDEEEFPDMLAPLSSNTALKSLRLEIIPEINNLSGFEFFRENTALEELILGECTLTDESFLSLFQALCTNSCLRTLKAPDCYDLDGERTAFSGATVEALVQMLSVNLSIRSLHLSSRAFSTCGLAILLSGLKANKSLKVFNLDPSRNADNCTETAAFVQSLLSDTCLEEISVGPCSQEQLERLIAPTMARNRFVRRVRLFDTHGDFLNGTTDIIEKLNASGRRYLFEEGKGPGCRNSGVNVLVEVRDGLDCLFYHLRENASLCEIKSKGHSMVTTRKKRRRLA